MTDGTTHYIVAKFAVGSDIQWHNGKVTTQQTINGWKFCTFETGFGQVLSEAFTSNQTNKQIHYIVGNDEDVSG